MSYLVLARKWRPQTFEEVVGQQAVIRTLQNAIERKRIPHAVIFSGVRGVGKTTLARIVAKALNCQEGPTKTPCNSCEHCMEITAGSAIDIHEIDGASNRGIQEIRELKENIRFFPTKSRYKVIIIDEVHMLTTEAFNALLKTLEEPPAHVIFMFATTELHKIPITILSRCQRYELQKVSSRELFAFFTKIARQEKISISEWALNVIVREAGGSVRDGLSLLDQIFSFGGDEITDDDVTEVLGLVDSQVVSSMAEAVLNGDLGAGLGILEEISGVGVDLKRLANDLLYYFRSLLVCRLSTAPEKLLDLPDMEFDELRRIAAGHSAETLQLYFNMLLKGVETMQYSSHPRLALEMALIRAAEAGNVVPLTELLQKLDSQQHTATAVQPIGSAAPVVEAAPTPTAKKKRRVEPRPKPAAPTKPDKAVAPAKADKPVQEEEAVAADPPAAPVERQGKGEADESLPRRQAEKEATENLPPPSGREVRRNWDGFIEYVMDRKKWMAHTLRLSSGVREEGSDLILKFDDPSDCKMLQSKENMKFLTEFSQDFFQKEFKVRIKIRGGDLQGSEGENGTGPQEERRALANDPLVQMTTEILGGRVTNIRTGPRSR